MRTGQRFGLGLLTLQHLLVDGVCGAVLCRYAINEPYYEPIVYWFSVYTVIAFGLQGIMGLLLDVRPGFIRSGLIAAALLLCLGTVPSFDIMWQVIFIGLGNCLFHVAGGIYVLRAYDTFFEPGVFVCSGAVGLGLGLNGIVGESLMAAVLVLAVLITVRVIRSESFERKLSGDDIAKMPHTSVCSGGIAAQTSDGHLHCFAETPADENLAPQWQLGCCAFFLLSCVMLRGFSTGETLFLPVMILPCVFAAGKLCGGFVCDKIGYRRTILIIFLLGFVSLQVQDAVCSLLFIFSCNMTMPLTLRLLHWCKRERPGMMFGLAAACLVPGTVFKGLTEIPPQLILALQFVILAGCGYVLTGEKNADC